MQSLGLTGDNKRSDGRLKSIFWPTVENAWDVDYLGQQGFWICLLIAIFQLGVSLLTRDAFAIGAGLVAALIYYAGGMGVREKSWPAATVIFACYFIETLIAVASGVLFSPADVVKIIFLGLLLSNLRATFIASEWKAVAEGEDRPERFSETFRDKLVDVWPARLWPLLQVPFYGLGAIWFVFSLIALMGALVVRLGLVPGHLSG